MRRKEAPVEYKGDHNPLGILGAMLTELFNHRMNLHPKLRPIFDEAIENYSPEGAEEEFKLFGLGDGTEMSDAEAGIIWAPGIPAQKARTLRKLRKSRRFSNHVTAGDRALASELGIRLD